MVARRLVRTVAVAAALAAGSVSLAHEVLFEFTIDGDQVVPPSGSPGEGHGTLILDTHLNTIEWDISFSGLLGDVTAAHFHGPAAPGQNAGVQIDIGAISGLQSPMIGSTEITDQQRSMFLGSLVYVNIHSSQFPGGEIRGQVIEPPPSLLVRGECPGPVTLVSSGNTPAVQVAFLYAFGTGSFIVPSGPCAGTQLGLDRTVTLGGVVMSDSHGDAILSANAPPPACGRLFLQSLDVLECEPSTLAEL